VLKMRFNRRNGYHQMKERNEDFQEFRNAGCDEVRRICSKANVSGGPFGAKNSELNHTGRGGMSVWPKGLKPELWLLCRG
jgi:hypothetical protein